MIQYPIRSSYTFLGLPQPRWQIAKVALLPIPYDATTSYQSGTRFGPEAMLNASKQLELYDEEFDFEPIVKFPVYTLDEMEPQMNHPGDMIEEVRKVTQQIVKAKKFPFLFGGEHSLTFGAVQVIAKQYQDISVLHLDAHSDFRQQFEGTPYSHASVMRRSIEVVNHVTSVGLRSIAKDDMIEHKKFAKRHHMFLAPRVPIDEIISTLRKHVYVTVDIDVFDGSIMPATGTPQPGGLDWYAVTSLLRAVAEQRKVVGADIMEFMPIGGLRAPDFLAAKLTYKMMSYFLL